MTDTRKLLGCHVLGTWLSMSDLFLALGLLGRLLGSFLRATKQVGEELGRKLGGIQLHWGHEVNQLGVHLQGRGGVGMMVVGMAVPRTQSSHRTYSLRVAA